MGRKKTSVGGKDKKTTPAQRLKSTLSKKNQRNKKKEATLRGLQSLKGIKTEISKADSRSDALDKAIATERKK